MFFRFQKFTFKKETPSLTFLSCNSHTAKIYIHKEKLVLLNIKITFSSHPQTPFWHHCIFKMVPFYENKTQKKHLHYP